MASNNPKDFKWRHFHGEVILQCVRCGWNNVSYTSKRFFSSGA